MNANTCTETETNEPECYDWVDRRLQEMVDAEKGEPKEEQNFHEWVDRRLQEMVDAELRNVEQRHGFTYEELREYHQQRSLQRKSMCSLH
jgi:hypothetical protein